MAASSVSGTYRMQVEMQSGNKPEPRNPRAVQPTMSLSSTPATARADGAPAEQFAATITLPGYTHPPRRSRSARGRPAPTGQDAAWWPIGQDSIVLQFSQGPRSQIQLRGAAHGAELRGDVWFVSTEGASFQLGSFTATKGR